MEVKTLKTDVKKTVLTGSRWCLLKQSENCTENQATELQELVAINLKTVRAYLLKEDFHRLWNYKSVWWAAKLMGDWCKKTMRSRIDRMKKVARMLRSHRSLFLKYFRAKEQIALSTVKGLNNKAKVTTKKTYGFKGFEVIKLVLYHTIDDLPEPVVTNRFCG